MQLLYVANRYEWKPQIERERERGTILDLRSLPGVEHRLRRGAGPRRRVAARDPEVPAAAGPHDPARHRRPRSRRGGRPPIATSTSATWRCSARVRDSYLRQASDGWVRLDADRDRAAVAEDVFEAVSRAAVGGCRSAACRRRPPHGDRTWRVRFRLQPRSHCLARARPSAPAPRARRLPSAPARTRPASRRSSSRRRPARRRGPRRAARPARRDRSGDRRNAPRTLRRRAAARQAGLRRRRARPPERVDAPADRAGARDRPPG